METSAGIGLHHEEDAAREVARSLAVQRVALALASGAVTMVMAGLVVLFSAAVDADLHAHCDAERDQSGYGRRAALRAIEEPERQRRFLYRTSRDEQGYRVRVIVQEGPFLGDTWERDAAGIVRHEADVCRDRVDGRWADLVDGA